MTSALRIALLSLLAAVSANAQDAAAARPMASVSTLEADAISAGAGTLQVVSGRALLSGNSSLSARDRTAHIVLTRGGEIRLCQTSALHLMQPGGDALLLALDRGALEFRGPASAADSLLTPDLRLTPMAAGELELDIRVTRNGDTCVDNRGRKAPAINIVDSFGQATYRLRPGQHVLFEHGSLGAVVDRETTPCGCPLEEKPVPLAEALLAGGKGTVTPQQTAAAYPFPAAVSAGLAPASPLPPETPGETHVEVASELTFDPLAPRRAVPPDQAAAALSTYAPTPARGAEPEPARSGPFRAVGRFFKLLFAR